VRGRSFDAFLREVLEPLARRHGRALDVLDLGSGNGWLCHRMLQRGHRAVALDVRTDSIDGLGAAAAYRPHLPHMFGRVAASFERLPFPGRVFDLALFNASLHYATELACVLREAARVVRVGGRLAVLDSPFYASAENGEAMVDEKRASGAAAFGELAGVLQAPRFVEFLTRERLERAVARLEWTHVRVRYPLWYEARPLLAVARGAREPSRFDLWWAEVAAPADDDEGAPAGAGIHA
jgi:SAM-dependent methyltransferase